MSCNFFFFFFKNSLIIWEVCLALKDHPQYTKAMQQNGKIKDNRYPLSEVIPLEK